jgi:hypothetical protein
LPVAQEAIAGLRNRVSELEASRQAGDHRTAASLRTPGRQ